MLAVVLIGGVWIFAPQITDVFNSEHSEQLAAYAVPGIRIYFAGFFAAAINIIFAGFLSATDHAKESSIVAITRGIVAIIAFALIIPKFLGITGCVASISGGRGAYSFCSTCDIEKKTKNLFF